MAKYLFIESRDPFSRLETAETVDLLCTLAQAGCDIAVFFVQNSVLALRSAASATHTSPAKLLGNERIALFADAYALAERGMSAEEIHPGVAIANMEQLVALMMEDGRKPVWY